MLTRREFIGSAAAAAAAQTRRPNILFLFPDQWRYDWTGLNKNLPVRTPHLNALAARGVNFTKAVVASPLCAPSRACLAAGKEYSRCGVPSNAADYPVAQTSYYALLRDSGYHVMGCGKLDLSKKSHDWGIDGRNHMAEWGFSDLINNSGKFDAIAASAREPHDPFMKHLYDRGLAEAHIADYRKRQKGGYAVTEPTPLPDDDYCDNWLSTNGLNLLRRAPKDKPWHLVVNFVGPHNPMDITTRMEKACRDRDFPQPFQCTQYDAATHVRIRQNYTAMVENLDRWIGIFIDELKNRGELDNTLIVFSSDHGEMLGDHDRWGKTLPWQESIGVPLVIAGPGVRRRETIHTPVTHMDLAATFLDYASVKRPADMDSRSMRGLLEGKTQRHRDFVLSGLQGWRLAWDGRYKLVTGFAPAAPRNAPVDAPHLLYDLEADPRESADLAQKQPARVKKMLAMLA